MPLVAALLAASAMGVGAGTAVTPVAAAANHAASGFDFRKPYEHATCPAVPENAPAGTSSHVLRGECVRLDFSVSNTPTGTAFAVKGDILGPDDALITTINAVRRGTTADTWRLWIPTGSFPAGRITVRIKVGTAPVGEAYFFVNALAADVSVPPATDGRYEPGEVIPVDGNIRRVYEVAGQFPPGPLNAGVEGATFKLQVRLPDGTVKGPYGPYTTGVNGDFPDITLPAAATQDVTAGPEQDFVATLGVDVIDATYTDPAPAGYPSTGGTWAGDPAGSGAFTVIDTPTTLLLESRFVSSRGWVKPGDTYPFQVLVKNATTSAKTNVVVTIPAPPSVTFVGGRALGPYPAPVRTAQNVTWTIPTLAAGTGAGPTIATLIVEARAATFAQDPQIAWKDLSATATLTYLGGSETTATTHGPKVIPPAREFETARYGDKPFPMVPVDYLDRKHKPRNSGEKLSRVVNSPDVEGSTFNLYQEMSYGQLFPNGTVPSAGVATAGFEYEPGFQFSEPDPTTCRGVTYAPVVETVAGTPLYPERIHDGWYQLPGDTEYYGGDFPVFTAGAAGDRDNACGPRPKAVYDAAQIADPEIDYNQFDTDKDGVVDFFMLVFVGCGGNLPSQGGPATCGEYGTTPYDNIWPHSYTLEAAYTDEATGLSGYISDDQLTDLDGNPQCWTTSSYSESADCTATTQSRPVHVRVGPYNVNPEDAIDHASVISHEYGHFLGLPDFYSDYSAYADLNLMASDYSQHMTIFGKQEMGWVVPDYLKPNQTLPVPSWREIKNDTREIHWQTPDGVPYTLQSHTPTATGYAQNIHNGQAYGLKLPGRQLIDPAKVAAQASAPDLIHSGRGDNFGCAPEGGHNIDISLPELRSLAAGTNVTLTFKSSWDIEWDYDYGFTMVTTNGETYKSLPSKKGYTTPKSTNPSNSACLNRHDNGLTGTSGAYQAGSAQVALDRQNNSYDSGAPFVVDEYDLTEFAGKSNVVLRFSYYTDGGFDRPGWFIDDLAVKAGTQTLYSTNFTDQNDEARIFNGGCNEAGQTAARCTAGWDRIKADATSRQDHAYYLELRDRSGFDYDGKGQSDRGAIVWDPGVLLEYTDEIRGYGNSGGGQPPRQHYLDSQPTPGSDCGDGLVTPEVCENAAFTAANGDNHFDDDPIGGADPGDWVDNFQDPSSSDNRWHFAYNCLSFDVTSMSNPGDSRALPSNLTAAATIRTLAGCATYDYGVGGMANARPTADATARPTTAHVGQTITFDGSGSTDDRQSPDKLQYKWDLNGDNDFNDSVDKSGMSVTYAYTTAGTRTIRLRVTDANGASSIDSVQIKVTSGKPDLDVTRHTVTNLTRSGTTVRQGDRLRFTATVKNIGSASARQSHTEWYLYGPNRVLGNVVTNSISAGSSRAVTMTWNTAGVAPGRYRVRALADRYNVVAESNGNNNTWFFYVTITR